MPDSSAIDNALLAKLGADTQLMALMPNLVHWQVPLIDNPTRYVVVTHAHATCRHTFGRRSWEELVYIVKAVGLRTANPDMQAAGARIDALLDGGTLTVPGYTTMALFRDEDIDRIRDTERDEIDPTIVWYHRGGYYRVVMST